jgi:hypothetical protein
MDAVLRDLSARLTIAAALTCSLGAHAAGSDAHTRAGDVLSLALPAGVAAFELVLGDMQGLRQFGLSWGATLIATEALKRSTQRTRPDGSNDLSFPSGHAARAFGAAAYVHRRHGLQTAWPLYAASTYVGWTRVQALRHDWRDVAGSAALSAAFAWWLVEPSTGGLRVSASALEGDSVGVWLQRSF